MLDAVSDLKRSVVKKPINIRIDADLHDRMKHYCIDNNTTITRVTTELFEGLLDGEGGNGREEGHDLD